MVAKTCAVLLVLLIVLPFTAPFITCGPADLGPLCANRRGVAVAQDPASEVSDDAIVASERTIAIRRPELAVLNNSGCGDVFVQLVRRTGLASSFNLLPLHDRPSVILRV